MRFWAYKILFAFAALCVCFFALRIGNFKTLFGQDAFRIVVSAPVTPLKVALDMKKLETGQIPPMVAVPEGQEFLYSEPPEATATPDPLVQLRAITVQPSIQSPN